MTIAKVAAPARSLTWQDALRTALPTIHQGRIDAGRPALAIGIFGRQGGIIDKYCGLRDVEKGLIPDVDTIFNIGSMCKGFTALAVACLVADGKACWDDPVGKHVVGLRDTLNGRFTIRDLLSHRTGLCRSDALFIGSDNELLVTKDEGTEIFASLDAPRPLRQEFVYNNLGYHAVGRVVEEVSFMEYGEFLAERIFKPLGMHRTFTKSPSISDDNIARAYVPYHNLQLRQVPAPRISSDTVAFAAGSIRSCMGDLLAFYSAMLRKFTALLPNSVFHDLGVAWTEVRVIFEATVPFQRPQMLREQSYGMGWARTQLPNQLSELSGNSGLLDVFPVIGKGTNAPLLFHHGGNNIGCSSSVYMMPELESGIVVLGNALGHCDATGWAAQIVIEAKLQGSITTPFIQYIQAASLKGRTAMERVQAILDKEKVPSEPPEDLEKYTGTFWHRTHLFRIEVRSRESANGRELQAMFQGRDNETYTLRHYHHDIFVFNETYDHLVERGQWCRPYWFYKIQFCSCETGINALRWKIDDTGNDAQIFKKLD